MSLLGLLKKNPDQESKQVQEQVVPKSSTHPVHDRYVQKADELSLKGGDALQSLHAAVALGKELEDKGVIFDPLEVPDGLADQHVLLGIQLGKEDKITAQCEGAMAESRKLVEGIQDARRKEIYAEGAASRVQAASIASTPEGFTHPHTRVSLGRPAPLVTQLTDCQPKPKQAMCDSVAMGKVSSSVSASVQRPSVLTPPRGHGPICISPADFAASAQEPSVLTPPRAHGGPIYISPADFAASAQEPLVLPHVSNPFPGGLAYPPIGHGSHGHRQQTRPECDPADLLASLNGYGREVYRSINLSNG